MATLAPSTLGEFNERLKAFGLPPINEAQQKKMLELKQRERILEAVVKAGNNVNAKRFLENLLHQVGAFESANEADVSGGHAPLPEPNFANDAPPPQAPPPQANHAAPPTGNGGGRPGAGTGGHQGGGQPPSGQGPAGGQGSTGDQGGSGGKVNPEDRYSVHVYGGKAALCFEHDLKRNSDLCTVAIDAATSIGERRYNWQEKVRLQVTQQELPVVTAVLCGILPACEFGQHGPEKNKGFSFERQDGGKIFVRVFAKDQGVKAVPMEAPDVFRVASLFVRQIRLNQPWLDATGVLGMLRTTLGEHRPRTPRR